MGSIPPRFLPPDEDTLHPFAVMARRNVWERQGLHPSRTEPWALSDEFWAQVQPLVVAVTPKRQTGRPGKDDRLVFEAVIYVLRTGCAWKALPSEPFGSSSAIHTRFKSWYLSGLFEAIWNAGLAESAEMEGIAWRWYYRRLPQPSGITIPVFFKQGEAEMTGFASKIWRPEIRERKPRQRSASNA